MARDFLHTDELAKPIGCYSYGANVEGGRLIYLAGMVSLDRQGNIVGKDDMKAQISQIVENIKAALKAGGATLDDVIKHMIFTTDIRQWVTTGQWRCEQFPGIFGKAPRDETGSPGTVVEIKRLGEEDLMVEIEVIAHVR